MSSSAESLIVGVTEGLVQFADPERGRSERKYLHSERAFLGVSVPNCRRVVRSVLRSAGEADRDRPGHDQIMEAALQLWDGPFFEHRRASVELLAQSSTLLGPEDLGIVENLIRNGETWALVDDLSIRVAGPIVERFGDESGSILDRWASDDESFWLRRASMLSLLGPLRSGEGDWDRFCRYADQMLYEKEFFIRKAIGWVLRETSKKQPERVRTYVEPRLDAMSGVTRREAVKYL